MEDSVWFWIQIVFPLILIVYYYYKKNSSDNNYWKKKGVPQINPKEIEAKFVGNTYKNVYVQAKQDGDIHKGTYAKGRPIYVATDINLIKNILIKDFEYFINRGIQQVDEKNDPLSATVFALENERWKTLRTKLTPTFTSGKMKMMFPIFLNCTKGLSEELQKYAETNAHIDIKELLACFSTDVITNCAFGLDCNSLANPKEPFRQHGRMFFEISSIRDIIKVILLKILPRWFKKMIGLRFIKKNVEKFFMDAVSDMVEYREKNNVYRPDFMHLLLQLKNLGRVTDDKKITENGKTGSFLSKPEFAAQCFVFFTAGFETSSSVTMFTLFELSKNQDIQNRLRSEIRSILEKNNGDLTYQAIADMAYLDQVVKEGLRLYPSLSILNRVCNQEYKVPGTDVVLEKDTMVHIPVYGIHTDPDYYPDPLKFNPEHFTKENEANRPACTYMPFGEGPRLCIGSRFGLMQVKMALATLIRDYRVTLDDQSVKTLELISPILLTNCKGKIYLNVEKV